MGTAESLDHIHRLLHLLLQLQGIEQQQITELLGAKGKERTKHESDCLKSHAGLATKQDLKKLEKAMSAALDRLTNEVAETKTAVGSVLKLVDGLADQIRALKDDPAKLEALANDLDAQQNEIAAKVLENTPSE